MISDSVIDEGQLNAAIKRLKPTHIFRMKTISAMTVNGNPQNIAWQIEVHQRGAKPNSNTFEAAAMKSQSQITDSYKSIYKFNIQSEICTGLRALRESTCADEFASTELLVPHDRYDVIARLHQFGDIQDEEQLDGSVRIKGRFPPSQARFFAPFVVKAAQAAS